MISEPFATGSSMIHDLDPRVRIVFAAAFALTVALSYEFGTLAAAFLVSCLPVILARLRLGEVAKRLLLVNGLILFLWIVLPLTYGGQEAFQVGSLTVYRQGLVLSAQVTLKSNAILLACIGLLATMSVSSLGHALDRMHMPGKIVHLLLLTYRYIFVIEQEYQRLMTAAKVRSFRPRTNLHTYRTYAYLMGMLFVRSSDRAERVDRAMRCRGFRGRFYCLREFSLDLPDWIWIGVMTITITGLGALEWLQTT